VSKKGGPGGLRKNEPGLLALPEWSEGELLAMNEAFRQTLMDAVPAGAERCLVGISTKAGTRHPLYGYRRPD
jgi:hypothetical protein